ncbi:MAG: hypothetical protein M3Z75_25930 [Actinomycetota bacterium]|nr:hypothetical protein [Actinomycetota bacterium]
MSPTLSNLLPDKGSREGSDEDDKNDDQGSQGKDKGSGGGVKNKHVIEEHIDVGVPHQTAYNQWTQYDKWSKIFKKESAKREDNSDEDDGDDSGEDDADGPKVTVTAKIGPSQRQWEVEILEQVPGRRIVWEAKGGIQVKGIATFHRLDDRLTHLTVNMEYRPSGFMETIGNFFRMQRRRVRKDLKLFKNYVDLRGEATGEGPGEVRGEGLKDEVDSQVEPGHGDEGEDEEE